MQLELLAIQTPAPLPSPSISRSSHTLPSASPSPLLTLHAVIRCPHLALCVTLPSCGCSRCHTSHCGTCRSPCCSCHGPCTGNAQGGKGGVRAGKTKPTCCGCHGPCTGMEQQGRGIRAVSAKGSTLQVPWPLQRGEGIGGGGGKTKVVSALMPCSRNGLCTATGGRTGSQDKGAKWG